MAINTTAIENLMRPGLAAIIGPGDSYNDEWREIFTIHKSDKNFEQEIEMKMLGLGQLRPEGAPTAVGTMGQRFSTIYLHRYVALSFAITRQAIKDNLYKQAFPQMAKSLKRSLDQTKEILGAAVLNNGFLNAYPIGDGQPLYSTAHPIDGGTYANRFAINADLNEASLESALIGISLFKDQAGLVVKTLAEKMIVPPQGEYVAQRLLGSEFRTNTANNDISATYQLQSVPKGYRVNHYLTHPNGWYLITNADNGFKHYVREELETDVYTDFSTSNLLAKAEERYSFGNSNARSTWGSEGT